MGKICTQWSEIVIHPSVGKAGYSLHFALEKNKNKNTPNIFSAKKIVMHTV